MCLPKWTATVYRLCHLQYCHESLEASRAIFQNNFTNLDEIFFILTVFIQMTTKGHTTRVQREPPHLCVYVCVVPGSFAFYNLSGAIPMLDTHEMLLSETVSSPRFLLCIHFCSLIFPCCSTMALLQQRPSHTRVYMRRKPTTLSRFRCSLNVAQQPKMPVIMTTTPAITRM